MVIADYFLGIAPSEFSMVVIGIYDLLAFQQHFRNE